MAKVIVGEPSLPPYRGYNVYQVFHRKEGRWYVCLVPTDKKRRRHSMSRARYVFSVKLGRVLHKHEQVDHIDGDKTNDYWKNLQILSVAENNRKYVRQSGRTARSVKLVCPNCRRSFFIKKRQYAYKQRIGTIPCCSRSCGSSYGSRNRKK